MPDSLPEHAIAIAQLDRTFSVMSSLKALAAAGKGRVAVILPDTTSSTRYAEFDAQTAITHGASVLIVDALDPGVGAAIESYANARGVATIDYDRLVPGGSRHYYVSFDNVLVGTKIGQGMVDCAAAWHVKNPNVLVMYGDPSDNNAVLFARGYNAVMAPLFKAGTWTSVGKAPGTWDPSRALAGSSSSTPRTTASTRCSRPTTRTPRRS